MATFSVDPTTGGYPGQAMWVTIAFNEDVAGLASNEIVVTNGSVSDFTAIDARTYLALVTIASRPNTSGTLSLAAAVAAGANSRPSEAASINLLAPSIAAPVPSVGGSSGCGLGSGFALLLVWLIMGLNVSAGLGTRWRRDNDRTVASTTPRGSRVPAAR